MKLPEQLRGWVKKKREKYLAMVLIAVLLFVLYMVFVRGGLYSW